jgi:hypothetical protein
MLTEKNHTTRSSVLLTAAVVAGTLLSAGATAAPLRPTQGTLPYCPEGMSCVPMTPQTYNRCYQLALKRGFSVYRFDDYYREGFIHKCLRGRIPG